MRSGVPGFGYLRARRCTREVGALYAEERRAFRPLDRFQRRDVARVQNASAAAGAFVRLRMLRNDGGSAELRSRGVANLAGARSRPGGQLLHARLREDDRRCEVGAAISQALWWSAGADDCGARVV